MGQEELEHLIGKTKKDLEELEDEEEGEEKAEEDGEKEGEMDDSASVDGSEEAGEAKEEMDEDAVIEAKYGMDDYGNFCSLYYSNLIVSLSFFILFC